MHFRALVNTIKTRREVLEVTQEELAKIAGVSLRTLKAFEAGNGNPTLRTLSKIADKLGLEVTFQVKKTRGQENY